MKYKVGDRVRIKGLDWYNKNKDEDGDVPCDCNILFLAENKKYLGTIQTVEVVYKCVERYLGKYIYKLKGLESVDWTDDMIEGLAEDKIEKDMEEHQKICDEIMAIQGIEPIEAEIEEIWHCPDGYQFKDENGNVINATKIVLEKKKKEYPKTYEGCWYMLKHDINNDKVTGYKNNILSSLQKLLICRDAYWKIAGEEMGLGKPWEPDWTNENQSEYGLYEELKTTIINPASFLFPTEEMRDAFKENFDKDLEFCKELL